MKKKIINGILMSALLLAGTTSFVSCKDNVDDVETGIRFDMGTMNKQIAELETRIAILEAQDMGVEQLKKDLEALKAEVAKKADQAYVDEEINGNWCCYPGDSRLRGRYNQPAWLQSCFPRCLCW